jgi:hypothetical protein
MSDDGETTLETPGLDRLIRALKAKSPTARVGILGSKAARKSEDLKSPLNNAEIGALYEFNDGSKPGGSFLRVPISEHLEKEMERSGALDESTFKQVIAEGSVIPWMKKIAVLAEGIVAKAFDTGGFGKWKPSDMTRKTNHQTLVETQQLRNSITSEVKE